MGQIYQPNQISQALNTIGAIDVVIAGSGPAGAIVAQEVAAKGLNVVILEAGNHLPDTDAAPFVQFSKKTLKSKLNFGLSWQFGGASNLWSGRCAPLEPSDICKENGWPFAFAALAQDYKKAAKILGLSDFDWINSTAAYPGDAPEWQALEQDDTLSVKRFQWNQPCFNAGVALSEQLKKNDNLSVFLNARVLKLRQAGDAGLVTSVDIAVGDTVMAIEARYFVLATGGIETPRILLNSDENQSTGLGNSSGAVGRYFSTHPKGNVGTLHLARPVSLRAPMFSDTRIENHSLRFGLGRNMQSNPAADRLNHYVQFSPKFEKMGLGLLEHLQYSASILGNTGASQGKRARAIARLRGRAQMVAILAGRALFNIIGKIGLVQRKASILTVRGFFDQHPSPDNRVTLSEETDRFGMPKAKVDWQLKKRDADSIVSFLEYLQDTLQTHKLGHLDIHLGPQSQNWPMTGIHSHFMGTTRMGTDPESSVTDSHGRLHDCHNVYIAGSSLFSSFGYANPVLTICALSLRVARGLLDAEK